jgi:hypothetical protein
VHEDVIAEPSVNEVVEEDGNWTDVDEVQPLASLIYSLPEDAPPPMLLILSEQPIETTPSIHL